MSSPSDGLPDPLLLPLATGQAKDPDFDYGRGLVAGGIYVDPASGVKVVRVTDADTPSGNVACRVNYAAAGPHFSLPRDERWSTMYFQARHSSAPYQRAWFVDIDILTLECAHYRLAPDDLHGADGENAFAFSYNPETPHIAYTCAGSSIKRIDTITGQEVPGDGFPKNLGMGRGSILYVDRHDEWFACEKFQKLTKYFWNSKTDQLYTFDEWHGAQVRLDRNGLWGYIEWDGPQGVQVKTVDLETGQVSEPVEFRVSHPGSPPGYVVGVNPGTQGGFQLEQYNPVTQRLTELGGRGEIVNGSGHHADQWVHGNRPGLSQWVLVSTFGHNDPAVFYDAIGLHTLNPHDVNPRLLCHTDSKVDDYYDQPHANQSPNGRLVGWETSMNNAGGRTDIFVARVPG